MIDVLKRHYPELEPALRGVENAFAPWTRVGAMRELAEGVHCLGGRKGGRVRAFLLESGGELTLVDTLFEADGAECSRRDPTARPEPARPEADRPHPRTPLASRRARGAEAGESGATVLGARLGGGHRRRRAGSASRSG